MGSTEGQDISAVFNEAIGALAKLGQAMTDGPPPEAIAEKMAKLRVEKKLAEDNATYWQAMATRRTDRITSHQETIDGLRVIARDYEEKLEQRDADLKQMAEEKGRLAARLEQHKITVQLQKRAIEGRDRILGHLREQTRTGYSYLCTMCHAESKQVAAVYIACGHSVCADHVDEVIEGGA